MAETFGPYRLDSLIGRGAMGEIYRAFDTVRGRFVALKLLPGELAANPEFRARFQSEAALAARLKEPHILPIHDFGEIDGRLFIDMRLVEGPDLAALLAKDGPLPYDRAVDIVSQLAAALDAAHQESLVHRDIKPSNVLVVEQDDDSPNRGWFAYLTDFGIARVSDSQSTAMTRVGATLGSPAYMAPELFNGGRGDRSSDVYALGCLLFEVLTGHAPFTAQGYPALIHAHLSAAPPRPSEVVPAVPAALDAVVATAMAKDPRDRHPSAGALAADARAAVDASTPATNGIGTPATPAPLLGRLLGADSPGRRSRRGLLVLAAIAAALALVGGTAFALGANRGPEVQDVYAEPVHTPGANPFMPPVGDDRAGVAPPRESAGSFSGATPGLYGGTRNKASCDAGQMVAFLLAHPDKAAAWAGVQGITPDRIPAYVAQLTPVLLRSDTSVTNHGFASGRATTLHSVLQAGTAILVDTAGVPRAKCFCGNPLTPPMRLSSIRYSGTTWPGLSLSRVTTVQPSGTPIARFTLVDVTTGEAFYRPAGGQGPTDTPAAAIPAPVTTTSVPTTSAPGPAPAPPPQQGPTGQDHLTVPTTSTTTAPTVKTTRPASPAAPTAASATTTAPLTTQPDTTTPPDTTTQPETSQPQTYQPPTTRPVTTRPPTTTSQPTTQPTYTPPVGVPPRITPTIRITLSTTCGAACPVLY